MNKISIFCIFICLSHFGVALQCYTCSVGEIDVDKTCIDHPEELTITNCNKKYCTLIRQENKDNDKVISMFRGCADQPLFMNQTVEDETYRFYYLACQEDLCNGGSGKFETTTTSRLSSI